MIERKSDQPFSYDQAVEKAKANPGQPVAINSQLIPGVGPGYNAISWDGRHIRLGIPGKPTTTGTAISTGKTGQGAELVNPLPSSGPNANN